MAVVIHRFDPPERFVCGTVGPVGQRTFFLQARRGPLVTSVALEKEQVAVLAERIDSLLDEVVRATGGEGPVPAVAPQELTDTAPLEQPITEEFRAGTMTLSWDVDDQVVVLEVFPLTDSDAEDDDDAEPQDGSEEMNGPPAGVQEMLLVRLEGSRARAFAKRALSVVAAGRPPCPFCGGPLDPDGHLCPRANGFRRIRR
jgi:uncharacterized repeat protein (TIGR03847 family)